MKTGIARLMIAGCSFAAGLMLFAGPASADARITIQTPQVSVSFGHQDAHVHYEHHDVHHHKAAKHHKKHKPPKHVCRYERVPVQRSYYDECGRLIHYTELVTVQVCESYHRAEAHHKHKGKYAERGYSRDRSWSYRSVRHYDD